MFFLLSWIQTFLLSALNILLNNIGKALILSIESGSVCKHEDSSEQSGSYTTLSNFLWEQNPVWNNMTVHPTGTKNIIVHRRTGFSLSSPSLLPETMKMETYKVESWLVVHHALWYQFILCQLRGKDSSRRGRILKHCPRLNRFNRKYPLLS